MLPSAPTGSRPPLAGRQQELHVLQRLLHALWQGHGELVMIGGEVGVGKTSLVSEFVSRLSREEFRVHIGHCYDLESSPPYGPWLNSGIIDTAEIAEGPELTIQQGRPSLTPERRQILEFLRTHGPAKPAEVASSLGISANAATQSLRRLLASKHVTRPAYGVYATSADLTIDLGPSDVAALPTEALISSRPDVRRTLFQKIWDLLAERSASVPTMLVLEDMHWADQASVELLRYVGRKVSTMPILIIVTYRDAELDPFQPLYRYLPHIVREGNATRIALRRLNQDEIRDILTQRYALTAPDEIRLLRHLERYTDGNPFFIHEVLLTMEQDLQLKHLDDAWHLADLAGVHIPPLIRQVIESRLDHLDQQDRRLLQMAAVIGMDVPIDLLQRVSDTNDDDILRTMERARDAHIWEPVPGQHIVRFRHALVREALADSMLSLRFQALHQRVAQALLQQPVVDPDVIANHFRQANDHRAGEWLIRAGERAVYQSAWLDAVERFQTALEYIPVGPETAIVRSWLHFHIGMLSRRSDPSASLRSLQRACELAEIVQNELLLGLSSTAIGLIHCIFGEIRKGLSKIRDGVERLEALENDTAEDEIRELWNTQPLFVRLPVLDPGSQRGVLIHWLAVAGHYAEAIEMGREFVKRIPRQVRRSELFNGDDYYDAYLGLGHAYNMLGYPEEAAEALARVHSGYSAAANLPLAFLQFELMHLIYFKLDQPSERDRVERLVTEIWESHRGMLPIEIAKRFRPPRLLFWYGEWDEVERISRTWASNSVNTSTKLVGLGLGMLARYRGHPEEAWAWTNNALNTRPEDDFGNCWCELAMQAHRLAADLALDAGDLTEARRWIDIHAKYLQVSGALLGRAQHHLLESRYHELHENQSAALGHAEQSLRLTSDPYQPLDRQMAYRAVGHMLAKTGAWNEAETNLAKSYEIATRCSARFEVALTCREQASLLARSGKLAAARHKLAEARAIASSLSASPFLSSLAELSEFLADSSRKRSHPGGLSTREVEVLQLVAMGLTDAEIAERLFVSPRTVSGHLQSIYTKLNISSRTAATAYAFTHNLV